MPDDYSDKVYDVAIIGGGIAGAAIARDASLRGLSVILFEKNSFENYNVYVSGAT